MTPSFAIGLVACALLLPWVMLRLHQAGERCDPRVLTAVAAGHTPRPVATHNAQPVNSGPVAGHPSGLKPESRPEAQAGEARRVVRVLPCHDCTCCTVYATRLRAAHLEIDRLRDEILRADGRRINLAPRMAAPSAVRQVSS